jgi:hypothetical protein
MTNGPFVPSIPKVKAKRARFAEDVPVTDEVARSIGHAVVEWGRVEETAGILTAILLGSDHSDFRAVSSNMMTGGKFDALAAVAKLKLPSRKAATIERIAKAIKGLQAERNRIIHGLGTRPEIRGSQRDTPIAPTCRSTTNMKPSLPPE